MGSVRANLDGAAVGRGQEKVGEEESMTTILDRETDQRKDEEFIRTACPRDCPDGCGVLVVKRHGKVFVRGDPDDPVARGRLCTKCAVAYNRSWRDPDARLKWPMRRTGPKGQGEFVRISWEEALDEIAGRLQDITESAGPETILNIHYSGTYGLLGFYFPMRFFNRLGATDVDGDTICNISGHIALGYVWGEGSGEIGFDPRTLDDANCVMVWGANPAVSAPHAYSNWLLEAPGTVVVIDPIRTSTAETADIHVQVNPGADAALAFGFLHVIQRDGLVDKEFVENHTVGWEELEETVKTCTPEWTASVTGVPRDTIEEVAHIYGRGPSLLWIGQALSRQPRGGNIIRSCSLLPAVTGNVSKPGAGFLYMNGVERRGIDLDYLTGASLGGDHPEPIGHMDLAERLEDADRSRAFVCWNMNIAASAPQQARLRKTLAREDLFGVVIDPFPTDTIDFADIALPAATFLEWDDLLAPYFDITFLTQVKAMEPIGEALPNTEIFRRLARKMGFTEPAFFESDRQVIDTLLRGTGLGETFESLAAKGRVQYSPEPIIQFEDRKFPTSSGRVEIASAQAEADGHPRVPRPDVDPRLGNGRFRLMSPASRWSSNDSFSNDPAVRNRRGPFRVTLNPDDAAELGLSDGDVAVVSNEVGEVELPVELSDAVPRRVAYSPKGRWPKLESVGFNLNALNPGRKSDMGDGHAVHGIEVSIQPARK